MKNIQLDNITVGLGAILNKRLAPLEVKVCYYELGNEIAIQINENNIDYTATSLPYVKDKTIEDYLVEFKYNLENNKNTRTYVASDTERYINNLLHSFELPMLVCGGSLVGEEIEEHIPVECISHISYDLEHNILKLYDMDVDIAYHTIDLTSGKYKVTLEDNLEYYRLEELDNVIEFLELSEPFGIAFKRSEGRLQCKFQDEATYTTIANVSEIDNIGFVKDSIIINLINNENIDCLLVTKHGVEC